MLFAALTFLAGCGGEREPVGRDRFIDVMVALREVAREEEEPERFDARKDSILRAAGVTDSMLIAFARVHGRDPAYMAAVWDTIAIRLMDGDTVPR